MKNMKGLEKFLIEFEATFRPLYIQSAITDFEALTTGDEEKYAESVEYEVKIQKLLSDEDKFAEAKEFNKMKNLLPIQKREVFEIYRSYLSHQADPELMRQISELDSEISQAYSTFRVKKNDKELTDNDILEILENSNDSTEVEAIWNDSKKVGKLVADQVVELAKLRNQLARSLNFENYWEMSLVLQDFEPGKLITLFDSLDELTQSAFEKAKKELDAGLVKRFNIELNELGPWHYGRYFQQCPKIFDLDLDYLYKDQDSVVLTKKYFDSIGLETSEIFDRSDLYEKKGKYQHACCFGVDAPDDVRVICNIKPNSEWMDTMLHEFGHGVYEQYLNRDLPWVLRSAAHIFTTEAVAIFFGTLASNPAWIEQNLGKKMSENEQDEAQKSLKYDKLIFSRFVQVMFRFEKAFYENPDQNLDELWWKLVGKYQLLNCPKDERAGDWASKIHIATAPVYYHNYLLGDLLASQFRRYIVTNISKSTSYSNDQKIGEYFKEKVFEPGQKYQWEAFVRFATNEELNPQHFTDEFCK